MTIPIGVVVVAHQLAEREVHSARPHAPQIAEATTPVGLQRTRVATAAALRRAASLVAPA